MRRLRLVVGVLSAAVALLAGVPALAQGFGSSPPRPRPWSRVSFFTTTARTAVKGGDARVLTELSTAFSYQLPDIDEDAADYGVDVRYAAYSQEGRDARTSIYEGFIGARLLDGRMRARAGYLWLNDVGALGSAVGATAEFRQRRVDQDAGRMRIGVFAGLEPNVMDAGYVPNVSKFGVYGAYDGHGAQRHSVGYVAIRNAALIERSVVTTTNFLPVRRKLFIYQAAEVNLQAPAGVGHAGLSYFFANARVTASDRVEFQGTYNRGRSVDARGLGDDVLNGRPIPQASIDGLLYESAGGRATVEVAPRVRVYAGVSRDKNNRDTVATTRILVGGYASNVGGSGFDLTASDSLMDHATGSYQSLYLSAGRQMGRRTYLSGDYSHSLSVIRFSRSDGIVIETHPQTTRVSATLTANVSRTWSLLGTLEHTSEIDLGEVRAMTGMTYRIR